MNADGSGQTNLTNNAAEDSRPAWSPDGSRIAFTSDRDDGDDEVCVMCDDEVYVMNADGTDPRNLTNNPAGDTQPVWSPVP
jgi:TolB protein